MLKAPRAGRVKTRLARDIGEREAVEAYRHLVEHQLENLPQGWPTEIYVEPGDARKEMREWLGKGYEYFPQCEGNLGSRLIDAMEGAFSRGADGLIFLGGDCPYVDAGVLYEARAALRDGDVVIGPTLDGGYYLIGVKESRRELFEGIEWGTESVFEQTMERVSRLRLKVSVLTLLEDVDDRDGLDRARMVFRKGF